MCPFYVTDMELVAHYHMKYEFQQKRQVQREEDFLYAASFISCNLLQPLSHKHHCSYLSGTIYQSWGGLVLTMFENPCQDIWSCTHGCNGQVKVCEHAISETLILKYQLRKYNDSS